MSPLPHLIIACVMLLPLSGCARPSGQTTLAGPIQHFLTQEKERPTTIENGGARLHQFTRLMQQMARNGRRDDVRRILTKEESDTILRDWERGRRKAAITRLKTAIGALQNFYDQTGFDVPPNQRQGMAPGRLGPRDHGPFNRPPGGRYAQNDLRQHGGAPFAGHRNERRAPTDSGIYTNKGDASGRYADAPRIYGTVVVDLGRRFLPSGFSNVLKLLNPAIDDKARKLYFTGAVTSQVGVIDLLQDELVESFDIDQPGGLLFHSDEQLHLFDFAHNRLYRIAPEAHRITPMDNSMLDAILPRDKDKPKYWGEYRLQGTGYRSFADGSTGFPVGWRQDLNAAYGVITIYHRRGDVPLGEIHIGPDALYFAIDQSTGRLYATNTGHGTISIYDLNRLKETRYCENNSCKTKEIQVGLSADQYLRASDGRAFVRTRLGGSRIYLLGQDRSTWHVVKNENEDPHGIGLWPTGMALDEVRNRLFVLSHYDARIDTLDATSGRVIRKITFPGLRKPRTDSISILRHAPALRRLAAVWPELGQVVIVDTDRLKPIGEIDLINHGFNSDKAANRGPGVVDMAINADDKLLYVYLHLQGNLLAFDLTTLNKVGSTRVKLPQKSEDSLIYNPYRRELYLGAQVLNATSLEKRERLPGTRVVGIDHDDTLLVVDMSVTHDKGARRQQETLLRVLNGRITDTWRLDPSIQVRSRFHFEPDTNTLYVSYFEKGIVKRYGLPR